MKKNISLLTLFLSFSLHAGHEPSSALEASPSAEVLERNHACLQEFEQHGCGKARADHEHFRSCVKDSGEKISQPCRTFFANLYEG